MVWVPFPKLRVLHVAVAVFPFDVTVNAAHPAKTLLPSENVIVPVGASPETLTERTIVVPTDAGLTELVKVTLVLVTGLTTWAIALLVAAVLLASPVYVAG